MVQTKDMEVEKLTIKALLSKLSGNNKNTLKEYLITGLWNERIDEIRATGFFISLGVAAKNEGIEGEGVGLSKELKSAVLAQL